MFTRTGCSPSSGHSIKISQLLVKITLTFAHENLKSFQSKSFSSPAYTVCCSVLNRSFVNYWKERHMRHNTPYLRHTTVEPGYNNVGLCDTSFIASDIVVPIYSSVLTTTLFSSVITTLVLNDTKYAVPFKMLKPCSTLFVAHSTSNYCRSEWLRCLRRRSAAAPLLGLRVRIPPRAWMSVSCDCCVLSDRRLCLGLITRLEESYRVWCV
jgi:hypothetical protein